MYCSCILHQQDTRKYYCFKRIMIQNYNTQKPFLAKAPTASRICFYQGIIFVNNAEDTKYREICKDVYQIYGGAVKILRSIGNMPKLLHLIIIYQLTRFIMKMTRNIKRILIIYYSWLLSRSTFSSWNQIYVVDVYRVTINHNSSPNEVVSGANCISLT